MNSPFLHASSSTRNNNDSSSERMVLPLWRSLHSLNLMLPKEDRKAMLLRLYNDDTPLLDHSKERFKKQALGSADEISEAEIEAEAAAEEYERIRVGKVRYEAERDGLEAGGVAIDPLAGEGIVTGAQGGGSGAPMENYGTSMGADNPAE